METQYDTEDLICALATPLGTAALAIIRTAGPGCVELLATAFSRSQALLSSKGGQVLYGYLKDRQGRNLDEVTLMVWRAPRSYTGQDSVEIVCHGSPALVQTLLENLRNMGFRPAGPGEFTLRAFLNGKLDLTRAEAVNEIISASTSKAGKLALQRLSGALEKQINRAKNRLLDLLALADIQLDYPDEDAADMELPLRILEEVRTDLQELLFTYRSGRLYQEGARVVLTGKTNAGKSSLFNLFLKEDRSIVSDIHGTTRDYLEAVVSHGGIPLRLYDTAGLRQSLDPLETEGIRRSRNLFQGADLIFYLVDAQKGLEPEDRDFLDEWGTDPRLVRIGNKVDLPGAVLPPGWIGISALQGTGFEELSRVLENLLLGGESRGDEDLVIESQRQKDLLQRALESLEHALAGARRGDPLDMAAVELQDALNALGEITGEISSTDILNHMFSNFCVGK